MCDENIDPEEAKLRIRNAMSLLNRDKIGVELNLQHAMKAVGGTKEDLYEDFDNE